MKKNIRIFLIVLIVVYFGYTINLNIKSYQKLIEDNRHLSWEEAGTDLTKSFNDKRKILNLPIIPDNWENVNPLDYGIQTWVNPDTTFPRYAEKTVSANTKKEFVRETDRYNLKRKNDKNYQIVIEFNYSQIMRICTLRETSDPEKEGKLKNVRYIGTIIDTLTYEQAIDTLKLYGLSRLNY